MSSKAGAGEEPSIIDIFPALLGGLGVLDISSREANNQLIELMSIAVTGARTVVILMVDSLSFLLSQHITANLEGLSSLVGVRRVKTVFPTITPTAHASLFTGQTPSKHGVILARGYNRLSREHEDVLNHALNTESEIINALGRISTTFISLEAIAKPFFSSLLGNNNLCLYNATPINRYLMNPVSCEVGNFTLLREALKNHQEDLLLVYVYFSFLDALLHTYGTQDYRIRWALDLFSKALEETLSEVSSNICFLVLGDHGQCDSNLELAINTQGIKEKFGRLSFSIAGDRTAYVTSSLADGLDVSIKEKVWEYSLNEVDKICSLFCNDRGMIEVIRRYGDVVLVCKDGAFFQERSWPRKGVHGGLSDEEIFVPLIVIRM